MDVDKIRQIKEMYAQAVQKKNSGDYRDALNLAYEIKNTFGPHYYVSDVVSCLLIDLGLPLGEESITKEGIELLENDFEKIIQNEINASNAYYNLANGYYSVFSFKWKKKPYFNCFKETELDQVKINLRKALEYNSQKPEILVNLGNCYDHLGRRIDALECYEKALELKSDHAMALGNKGIALCYYSRLMGRRWRTILIDAHYFISKALEIGVIPESKDSFIIWLKWIENQFSDKNVLDNPPEFPGYKIEAKSDLDRYIQEYCLENRLYLNVCNFCQKCNAAIGDSINIERMTVPVKDYSLENDHYLRLSTYLNQIKEDFIAARFLLILPRYGELNLDFVYDNVIFTDTLDYSQHDINIQLVRLSFKNFYDILDKIAFFINDYRNLNIKPRNIDFRKIWYSPWNGNPKKSVINKEIVKTQSYGLNALFDIHWDFEEGGPYNNLRMTRNALTHRFVKVKMFCNDENNEEMTEDNLVERTLELARIVRNAILYLMYFVNEMETKKHKFIDKEKTENHLLEIKVKEH
ncbi:MAG: tetratricopeptide repeat protein [Euryarchaeota archaeon]|nr:tetratricopeptide repeat protein [Euryarchaeota archaeon]